MADNETVTSDAPDGEVTKPALGLEEAGKILKQTATWADVIKQSDEKPSEDAAPEPDKFEGFTVGEDDTLVRPDGTPADEQEVEAYNAQPAKSAPIVVTLRGRNGDEREIEAADEETAEILRANQRDGLRGQEFRTKMEKVEEYLAERRIFEQVMETNPEALILQHLPEDKQRALVTSLLAKFWDQIVPELQRFDGDPAARAEELRAADSRARKAQESFDSVAARERYIIQVEAATRDLVPDHIDDATAEQFMADAGLDLGRAVQQVGRPVAPQDVKAVLAKRLALYGFDKPAPDANAASPDPTPPKRTIARAVARPNQPTTAPATATVKPGVDAGASVRRTVTAQRVAASVPPAGAGAATLRVPMVPQGTSIEQASQALRKLKSWSS